MTTVHIIVGSVLGASEYVADALSDKLISLGYQTKIHLDPKLKEIPTSGFWLLCSSTHGAGELPDNIQPFADELTKVQLNNVSFWVVSLGDSSYDTFCQGGAQLHKLMVETNAKALANPLEIDVLQHPIPEEFALEWINNNQALFQNL